MDSQRYIRHGKPHTYCYLDQDVGVSYTPLVFKTFSTQEILSLIRSIQTKHSSGYDEISTKLLTLNLPMTTIVAQPFNVIKWQLKFNLVA
jgi:hypothetical protein